MLMFSVTGFTLNHATQIEVEAAGHAAARPTLPAPLRARMARCAEKHADASAPLPPRR